MKKYLGVMEAAEYLGLPKSRIYDMTFRKTIPFYKIGATLRFKSEELDRFIEAGRVETVK